jgi:ankyrin repeat protein
LLDNGAPINGRLEQTTYNGHYTAFWEAEGIDIMYSRLVEAAIERRGPQLDDALWQVAGFGREDIVAQFLAADANPNYAAAILEDGMTTLMMAVFANSPEAVAALLAAGADVHARSESGATALHWSARNVGPNYDSMNEVLRMLVAAGADVNAVDINGDRPLDLIDETAPALETARTILRNAGAN